MADAPELTVNVSAPTPALAVHAAAGSGSGSGPGSAKSAIEELIITTLKIPIHLTDRSNKGNIRMAYAKYVALLAALKSMSALVTSGTWTHQTVSNDDMIEIFMSKSAYFRNHSKVFTMVDRYPQMKQWLLNATDGPPDFNVWGNHKHTFDVLKAILTPMPPPPVDIKGKGKEIVEFDLPVEKRKKKAAKTLKKKEKKSDYDDKKGKKRGEGSGKASTSKAHHVRK